MFTNAFRENDTEVVCHEALPVEEVVAGDEEPPGERPEPRQTMHAVHSVPYVDDLLKTPHLHHQRLYGQQ